MGGVLDSHALSRIDTERGGGRLEEIGSRLGPLHVIERAHRLKMVSELDAPEVTVDP